MKRLESGEKRVILSNPASPFNYFGWPTVCRLPDSALAAVCSGYRLRHVCPFGKAVISYSRDEGRTWTSPAPYIDTPLDDRDGGIAVFGNGRVILTSFNNTVAFQKACNSAPEALADPRHALIEGYLKAVDPKCEKDFLGSTYVISEDGGYTFGRLHISPITANHGPCPLRDGSLLYIGRRFNEENSAADASKPFLECRRLNENDEFEYVSSIEEIVIDGEIMLSCEPHAIELPDGRIIVHIRVQGRNNKVAPVFTLYQCESFDGGRSFTKPHPLLERLGGAPAHLLLHSGGTLISVYGHREKPYGIRAMLSRDMGETWENYVLTDDAVNGDLGYPATVELRDGTLLTVFYENTGNHAEIMAVNWKLPE